MQQVYQQVLLRTTPVGWEETTGQSGELDYCCPATIRAPANPRGSSELEWASRVGSRVPGLYTSAYPVTGYSLVPDKAKTLIKKKKQKTAHNRNSS